METKTYLNLLENLALFSGFRKIYIILCFLKGKMPFKAHEKLPEKNR